MYSVLEFLTRYYWVVYSIYGNSRDCVLATHQLLFRQPNVRTSVLVFFENLNLDLLFWYFCPGRQAKTGSRLDGSAAFSPHILHIANHRTIYIFVGSLNATGERHGNRFHVCCRYAAAILRTEVSPQYYYLRMVVFPSVVSGVNSRNPDKCP